MGQEATMQESSVCTHVLGSHASLNTLHTLYARSIPELLSPLPFACGFKAEVVARVLNVDSPGILSCVCAIRDIDSNQSGVTVIIPDSVRLEQLSKVFDRSWLWHCASTTHVVGHRSRQVFDLIEGILGIKMILRLVLDRWLQSERPPRIRAHCNRDVRLA